MYNRRKFLQTSGAAALGSLLLSRSSAAFLEGKAIHPIGLQLYTLFNVIDEDVPGNLKKVAAIGYREVESAFSKKGGFYGMQPGEFAKLCDGIGLAWKSHHVLGAPFKLKPGQKLPNGPDGKPIVIPPMKTLQDNMQELVDAASEGGIPFLVCANIPTGTLDAINKSLEILNKTGEACKKAGITLCYHNHTEEFEPVEGKIPYDLFLAGLTPDIKMELDICWATKAGADPVALFQKHPGRFPLWHVKDLDKERKGPAPVGTGVIDFKRIFAHAKTAGMQHFFVEHDMPADPFASITTSYQNITKMLG